MRGDGEVLVLDDQIADRGGRHVEPQRLPAIAVVEGHVHGLLGPAVEQPFARRILADDVHGPAVGQAVHDRLPRLAAVVGPIDVRPEVVEPQRVDRRVCGPRVVVTGFEDGHLGPRAQVGRCDVAPRLPTVARHVQKPVVGAHPDDRAVHGRGRDGVDDAALHRLCLFRAAVLADVRRHLPRLARQVGAAARPALTAVARLPQRVGSEIQRAPVLGREHERLRADGAVVGPRRGDGRDVVGLPAAPVVSGHLAAVHDVGVERVGRAVAVLLEASRVPLAQGDLAVRATARHAGGAAFLLSAAEPIREGAIRGDVEHLRGGLVVPGAPGGAAVHGDDRPLVSGEEHHVRIDRVDPDAVVVVASRRPAQGGERLPSVGGLPDHHAGGEHDVRVSGMDLHLGEVVGALGHALVVRDARPALARVVRAEQPTARLRRHGDKQAPGRGWRDADADAPEAVVLEVRESLGEAAPGAAAVGRFVEAAAGSFEVAVLPRPLARFPQRREDRAWIRRVEQHVGRAGVGVAVEHLLESRPAVDRAEHAALLVRPVRVAEHGDEQPVGVAGIDGDLRNLLRVAQPQVPPRLAAVGGLVDAVAGGEVGPLQALAAAHVDDVGIRRGDRDGADRAGRLAVEDGRPGPAVIVGPPHASVHRSDVEEAGLSRHSGGGLGAPAAVGADRAPAQLPEGVLGARRERADQHCDGRASFHGRRRLADRVRIPPASRPRRR